MKEKLHSERKWGAKTADERRAERRCHLMSAAIKIYGERGFRNCSVKTVCNAAGLTERYFYESFSNGEDILKQCFRLVTSELILTMRETADNAGGHPRMRVRAALLTYLERLRGNPPAARLFLVEMASISRGADALVSDSLDEFGRLLLDILHRESEGEAVPPLLLRGVIGGGLHITRAWAANGFLESIEDVADTALRLYFLVE